MSLTRTSALTLGFAGAFALGVWTSPHVRSTLNVDDAGTKPAVVADAGISATRDATPAARRAADARPAVASKAMQATAEPVQAHAKTLLNRGADVRMAAEGFKDAEQFVTVAYAARNTTVPFVVLKHRVLDEGKSLASAIRESNPDVDASLEVTRARANAQADLAKLGA